MIIPAAESAFTPGGQRASRCLTGQRYPLTERSFIGNRRRLEFPMAPPLKRSPKSFAALAAGGRWRRGRHLRQGSRPLRRCSYLSSLKRYSMSRYLMTPS
jgi:hypothetical protein